MSNSRFQPEKMHFAVQWLCLIVISALFAFVMELINMPGALLLGPMLAGIVWSLQGGSLQVPRNLFVAAQAIIGCLVAQSISSGMLPTFAQHWALFLFIVLSTIAASSLMGWVISKLNVLPGTTAIWGSSPGAAAAMVLMAEEFGADARLVAFMQYLRVIVVASAASIIARFWIDTSGATAIPITWFPPLQWATAETVLLALGGIVIARLARIPSGAMLVPMVLGMTLQSNHLLRIDLPEWLLSMAYAVMGWRIGLGFTRQVLKHASRALPQIMLSIMLLVGFCGSLAWLLVQHFHLDPLTAYLATSPGGMDSIAIIAASSHNVDLEFVMALQTVRLFLVIFLGPALARIIARKTITESSIAS